MGLERGVKKEILEGGFMYRVGGKYPVKLSGQSIDNDAKRYCQYDILTY